MDKQARKERIEKMITMEEALHTFEGWEEDLPDVIVKEISEELTK